MIAEAQVRSATFRHLVKAIEATDGIVYVEEGDCRHSVRACLPPLVTAGTGFRILRVLVDARQEDWDVMSDIAHELQHALEILSEPNVRTNDAVFFLYSKTSADSRDRFETEAAGQMEVAVRKEVAAFARSNSTKGLARTTSD